MVALAGVIAFMFAALVTRLWFLQVLAAEEYQGRAETNRIRLVPLVAPRGQILDRSGLGLVTNEQSIVVTVDRAEVPGGELGPLLERLSGVLHLSVRELRLRLADLDYLPFQPVPIAERVRPETVAYLAEHRNVFPGVDYKLAAARTYPNGPLAPHLLGYLGEINPDELLDPSFAQHLPGQLVGRTGVEQYYEHFLRGENGWQKIEVDASGEALRTIGRQEPVPGNDLYLSLDRHVQELAQNTLADAIGAARTNIVGEDGSYVDASAGAVVVLEPNTGHVLAMASFPSYDPRIFLQDDIPDRKWLNLQSPSRNYPIINRAIAGLYPPGSTFKPFVAAAAIRAGYANPGGYYLCSPEYIAPGDESGTVFHNWTDAYNTSISLRQSLVISCDTVYYRFGYSFYADRDVRGEYMQTQLERWGFGKETGVDIPGESDGRIPNQRWKEQLHQELPNLFPIGQWYPGDNINMSIGQGDVLVTPLQMAVAYGAIANGGTLYRPQVGLKLVDPNGETIRRFRSQAIGRVPASPQTLSFLRDALTGVVESGGTASSAFQGFPTPQYPVAGKTGTSEVHINGRPATHSWFAAIAPADDPQYVVVAMVEEGGHGSQVAAPIVRRILEDLLGIDSFGLNIAAEQAVD
jgi:penicillin-binding protein 2